MLVFLAIVLIGIGVGVIVMSGIASQTDSLSGRLHAGGLLVGVDKPASLSSRCDHLSVDRQPD